jgi:hypothetical protein
MDPARAREFAESLHEGEREPDGTPLLAHVRRVARMVPAEARAVAWLHEAFESTSVSEQDLLMEDLTWDELRALRLLVRRNEARSDGIYMALLDLIARAAGWSGHLARLVTIADLEDRCRHPRVRSDGWSPPYADGLRLLLDRSADSLTGARPAAARGRAAPV